MSEFGACSQCFGSLCIRGAGFTQQSDGSMVRTPAEVVCSRCGLPQVDHPMHQEMQRAFEAEQGKQPEAPPAVNFRIPYATDAVETLKASVAAKAHRIDRLKTTLQGLSSTHAEPARKRR